MEDGRPTKRLKTSENDYFEDASKEVLWTDIEQVLKTSETNDAERGWIAGQVFMIFGGRPESKIQLRSRGGRQLQISITCPEHSLFTFSIQQAVRISLRGASLSRLKGGTSAPGHLSFNLVYKDGAAVKFMTGGKGIQAGEIIDSWQVRSERVIENEPPVENWFMSSPIRPATTEGPNPLDMRKDSDLVRASSSSSTPFPETPDRNLHAIHPESSIAISSGDADAEEDLVMRQDVRELAQSSIAQGSKSLPHDVDLDVSDSNTAHAVDRRAKKPKKRDTRHERTRSTPLESNAESGDSGHAIRPKATRAERKKRKRERASSTTEREPSPPKRDPALDLVAGLVTEMGAYPPLDAIQGNNSYNVIGIVVSVEEPVRTRRDDFKVTLQLVDSSKFQNGSNFKVTCFMKQGFEHLLPSADKGHTLLLRSVRAADWKESVNGTVYAERLKWVAYNPDTGKLYYPKDSDNAPQSPTFSAVNASYKPNSAELHYLVQLGAWWRAVREEEMRGAIQIADYKPIRLEHRLIGTCEVDKFFNATVEILRIEEADSFQTMLAFTDYTPHPQRSIEGYYGQWGMHASTGRIDPAILDTMQAGTYWSIKNMRLKVGSTGNLEAELYGATFREVHDDDSDAHLEELLKRKEAYLREHANEMKDGRRSEHAESRLSDISEPGHYHIIAELLYRVNVRDTLIDLYVTDYTENPSLSSFKPEGLKRKLNGSPVTVLQIGAWDGDEFVRDMEIGCVCMFSDVRISRQHDGDLKGNLKFANKRITRMSVKKSDNPAVLALLRRKKEFSEGGQTSPAVRRSSPAVERLTERKIPSTTSKAIVSRHTDQPLYRIKQLKADSKWKCPNKFRLIARIVDFYPPDICDFTVRSCNKCKQYIKDNYNACTVCEDIMGEHVQWEYRFFFLLEDEEGERLFVHGHDEAKYFLRGLKPCDLKENHDALRALQRRLQGCLGNIEEVHERWKRKEEVEPEYGPYFDLAVRSWEISDGDVKKIGFALTGCEAVEPT